MNARLGKHQLCLLATMASPFSLLIVPDKVSSSLFDRGLLGPRGGPTKRQPERGFFSVTPEGLRTLADALERGDLEQFFDGRFQQRDRARIYIDGKAGK